MKKEILLSAVCLSVISGAFAFPPGGRHGPGPRPGGPGFGPGPAPMHMRPEPRRHGFWPGFVGGLAAGVLMDATRPLRPAPPPPPPSRVVYTTQVVEPAPVVVQPVVVQQPVVTRTVVTDTVVSGEPDAVERVWVEGAYFNRINADGSVTRVWNPGHYELRKVR